jgi:hypothetical protein
VGVVTFDVLDIFGKGRIFSMCSTEYNNVLAIIELRANVVVNLNSKSYTPTRHVTEQMPIRLHKSYTPT